MAKLVRTETKKVYETRCPHCRSTLMLQRHAYVTVELSDNGTITDLKIDCEGASEGQDRT